MLKVQGKMTEQKTKRKSYLMQTHIYRFLKRKYFKSPLLEFGSGLFYEDADYMIDLYDDTAKDHCKFIKHDLDVSPYPINRKFKTILCMRVIEYIDRPNVMLSEAYRLLDHDGVFILTVINDRKRHSAWIENKGLPLKDNLLTDNKLRKLLTETEFHIKEYCNSRLNLNYEFLQPLWKLLNKDVIYFVCRK